MALLAPQLVAGGSGTTITFAACAAGGDTVALVPGKLTVVMFANANASSRTVTVTAVRTSVVSPGGEVAALANIAVAVATGAKRAFVCTQAFMNSSGLIAITYSAVADLTVAVLQLDF